MLLNHFCQGTAQKTMPARQ